MAREFTAVFQHTGEWWIGSAPEVHGANGQGRTLEEARESLREAIELLLDIAREESEKELAGQHVVREVITVAS